MCVPSMATQNYGRPACGCRYPLESGEGEIVVATTRVETMLGDTAVAVHPEDPRCIEC